MRPYILQVCSDVHEGCKHCKKLLFMADHVWCEHDGEFAAAGQAGFVANMSDIAPRYAGRLFGLANTFGSFAGILGVSAVGFVVEKTGSFDPVFKLTAVMYIAATIVWNLMCTGERVFQ